MKIEDSVRQSSPEKAEPIDSRDEATQDGLWTVTELEATARDEVDVSIWESALEEERASADAVRSYRTTVVSVDSITEAPH